MSYLGGAKSICIFAWLNGLCINWNKKVFGKCLPLSITFTQKWTQVSTRIIDKIFWNNNYSKTIDIALILEQDYMGGYIFQSLEETGKL